MHDQSLLLFRELPGPGRARVGRLLPANEANTSETFWSEGVRVFLLGDPAAAASATSPAVVTVFVHAEPVVELVSLAVSPGCDERTVARRLIEALADRCRSEGKRRLVARPAEPRFAALLQTCGFRWATPAHDEAQRLRRTRSVYLALDLSTTTDGAAPNQIEGSPIPRA